MFPELGGMQFGMFFALIPKVMFTILNDPLECINMLVLSKR